MINKLFKRTIFLVGLILIISMLFGMTVFAENDNARYVMDAETLSDDTIAVLFIKGGTANSGVVSGGKLYFGIYDPSNDSWEEIPVGETASVAKEAALALYHNNAYVAYITSEDDIAYTYQTGSGWADVVTIDSNNCNDKQGTLYAPDIAVDTNGKVHITYMDTQGATDDYYKNDDGMYATNTSGSFVNTVVANGTGWYEAGDGGDRDIPSRPIKIALIDENYQIAYRNQNSSRGGYGSWDHWYTFQFKSTSNTSCDTNSGGTIYESTSDNTNFYTLISQDGKFKVLNKNTLVSETEQTISASIADMTLSGSDIYYATINGTAVALYQDGTLVEDLVADTSILSNHSKLATVISDSEQYIIYTGNDTDKSLVITKFDSTADDLVEFLVPNPTYTVTFNSNGGSSVSSLEDVEEGATITEPSSPTKDGYEFAGWYKENTLTNEFDFDHDTITEDITLFAKWNVIITNANCTITKPEADATVDLSPIATDSEKYSVSISSIYLYESPYPNLNAGDTYEAGKTYSYRIVFTANEGYVFQSGISTFTINGDETSSFGRIVDREIQYSVDALPVIPEGSISIPTMENEQEGYGEIIWYPVNVALTTNNSFDPAKSYAEITGTNATAFEYDLKTTNGMMNGTGSWNNLLFVRPITGLSANNYGATITLKYDVDDDSTYETIIGSGDISFTVIHAHSMTHHDAVSPTCTDDGTIEYWSCAGCGKNFSDAEGNTEAISIVDPATGHSWGAWTQTTAPTCTELGEETHTCANDPSHIETRPVNPLGHDLLFVALVPATTTIEGTKAHYKCSRCDKLFMDSTGAIGVTAEDLVIPKIKEINNVIITGINGPEIDDNPFNQSGMTTSTEHVEAKNDAWYYKNSEEDTTWTLVTGSDTFHVGKIYASIFTVEILEADQENYIFADTVTATVDGSVAEVTRNGDSNITVTYSFGALTEATSTTYTVTFDSNGGSAVANQNIVSGETATKPEDPTSGDLNFIGWFVNPTVDNIYYYETDESGDIIWSTIRYNTFDFENTPISGDIELKALWVAILKANTSGVGDGQITDTVSGDGLVFDDEFPITSIDSPVIIGMNNIVTLGAKENEGSLFIKWTKDGVDYSTDKKITVTITENTEFEAIFDEIEYLVTYDANGGIGTMSGETVKYYIFPECGYTAPDGKTFDKWEVNGTEYAIGDTLILTEDITVKATWKTKSFGGGGSSSSSYKVTKKVENGTISPDIASVKKNTTQEFHFTADEGYEIVDVLIDGKSVGAVESYILENVSTKHTIEIKTEKIAALENVDDWAKEEMTKAEEKGLIPETFAKKDATETITRTDFAAVAVRFYEVISGKTAEKVSRNPFTDTKDEYVLKAYAIGITNGTSETTFAPNVEITREQMATMLTRAISKAGVDVRVDLENTEKFVDDSDMHDWGRESVYYMAEKAIINGVGNNKFDGLGHAKIEEAIAIALRSTEVLEER